MKGREMSKAFQRKKNEQKKVRWKIVKTLQASRFIRDEILSHAPIP